jgi:hypothetical protein
MQEGLANNPLRPVTFFTARCCITAAHKAVFCLPLGDIRFSMPVLTLLATALHTTLMRPTSFGDGIVVLFFAKFTLTKRNARHAKNLAY